jgi:hypothetical protein
MQEDDRTAVSGLGHGEGYVSPLDKVLDLT